MKGKLAAWEVYGNMAVWKLCTTTAVVAPKSLPVHLQASESAARSCVVLTTANSKQLVQQEGLSTPVRADHHDGCNRPFDSTQHLQSTLLQAQLCGILYGLYQGEPGESQRHLKHLMFLIFAV